MEDKIEIDEFIRTKKGLIAKVCAYQDLTTYDDKGISVTLHSFDTDKGKIADIEVAKHSKDLVDLIEIGDVLKLKEDNSAYYIGLEKDEITITYQEIIDTIKENKTELVSIITKEKLKEMEYKLQEDKDVL